MKHNSIYLCLWFDGNASDAAELYSLLFPDTSISSSNPMVTTLKMGGQRFMLLNAGPQFQPNPAISFYVVLDTKEDVQKAWDGLAEGGKVLMGLNKYPWSEYYGWVEDKFGFSWQLALDKLENVGQRFSPLFMFTGGNAGKAEDAINHYTSVFDPSSVVGIMRYAEGEGDVAGTIKHAQFKIRDYVMMAMDSSLPHGFTFNEATSMVVQCDNQEEIDYYWNRLTEGGEESMCGWLKDKYGLSWQIVPNVLEKMMSNPEKAQAVVQAFLQMRKFDITALEKAYAGG